MIPKYRQQYPDSTEAMAVVLWVKPDEKDCLTEIADVSNCTVEEIIETILDDWAEMAAFTIETLGALPGMRVGGFRVREDVK